jgi:adenosylhomocysteinase
MSTATLNPTATEYKVADISLADFGRKEISIAEHEMPGLMAIRNKYMRQSKPLAGVRVTGSLHMTIQTAVLIETLGGSGRRRPLGELQYLFDARPRRCRHAAVAGVPVFAWKGESLEEYWWCTLTRP